MKNLIRNTLFSLVCIVLIDVCGFAQSQEQVKQWTLQECIDQALLENLNLQQSKLSVLDQEVNLKQNKADLFPTVNLGGNYGYNWGRGIDPTTNLFTSQRVGFTGFSANTNVTLFSGFQKQNSIKQSKLDLEASKKDYEFAVNDITLTVITLYLNVIFNKEILNNNQAQLASTSQQVERTKALVDAGSLPLADLLNIQSQMATNESNVVNADNNLKLSLLNLKQALVLPASEPFDVEVPQVDVDQQVLSQIDADDVYTDALNTQPDIISADLSIESAVTGEKIAKGANYPRLSVFGSLGSNYSTAADGERFIFDGTVDETIQIGYVQGNNTPVLSDRTIPNVVEMRDDYPIGEQFKDNFNQQLGLQLSVPVFNGLTTKSNIQRSKIQMQRAEINARQVRLNLRQIIEQAYNDALAASINYDASLRQVESLEESFRMAQEQYDLGVINFVEYQIAENNLFQAKSDLVRNKYNFIFKVKILDFYQGKPLTF